jgi:hypothetical protein
MQFRLLPVFRRGNQPMSGPFPGSGLMDHNPKTIAAAKQIVEKIAWAERSQRVAMRPRMSLAPLWSLIWPSVSSITRGLP